MITLGITDTMRPSPIFEYYPEWIRRYAPEIQIVKLSCTLDNTDELERCNGLLLSGGADVHPKFYHRDDVLKGLDDVNLPRDNFEFATIKKALAMEIPILGICRGMQLFNVACGGSLIPDIEKAGYPSHKKGPDGNRMHAIVVETASMFHSIVECVTGTVNTSHHQAVDIPASDLRIAARSGDDIVEAMEWRDPHGKSFLLLVQWHPERMQDANNVFSRNVAVRFIHELRMGASVPKAS
jgi:putative glutamine amidotransferase